MGSTFNPQILIEKLSKLNSSQQSIETLSHWCIFHMNKAKQVVETWDRQFHCSPSEQRLAFLYLANDILQNSRRKGSEFVGEFWKVLPDALRDVMDNGDDFGRNAVRRLIGIWEERKVFGSRGQILKEEFGARQLENSNRNGKHLGVKLKQSAGNTLEKIVSGYQLIYGGQLDEDVILRKCTNAISYIEKVDKEIEGDINSAQQNGSASLEELQGQHSILRDCIDQLTSVESSRASLVSYLREALQEQEFKLGQVRNQLQAAQFQAEQAGNLCRQLLTCKNNTQLLAEQSLKEPHPTEALKSFVPGTGEQTAPVMFTRQVSFPEKPGHVEEDPRKSAAAAVAAKLTASTSSAQMLTFVLSSLASEGVIGNQTKESSGDYPAEKRPRLDSDQSPYIPPLNPQPSVSAFPNLEQLQHNLSTTSTTNTTTSQQSTPSEQLPHPSSPPPLPPMSTMPPMPHYQVPQYMPAAGSMANIPYSYGMAQQQAPSPANFPTAGPPVSSISSSFASPPANSYQSFQGSEGGFYSQPSSLPMAPISRR